MKPNTFLMTLIAASAFTTASAQVEKADPRQEAIDDRVQQEQTMPTQRATENAARQADVNAKSNNNLRQAEDKLKEEKERSTGKDSRNPAETNATTVKPVRLSDPVSAPPNSGNR